MCGIFGYIGPITKELASSCVYTLGHRGPDGIGLWQKPEVTLGHTRLSIVDLSETGSQPMSYGDGRYWITYNGEIYNFLEIRDDLEKRGHIFRSESDTEVVLAAFAEWGEGCLEKFNGMWAFALWDDFEKRLFLSRDRFGKKPLFYSKLADGFVFASEMKAIIPLLEDIRPGEDFAWMRENLFLYEGTKKCLVAGIHRFPAGSSGVFYNGGLSVKRFWNTLDHLVTIPKNYDDQVEAFRELFVDACRLRMRSDVPVATALSGGLDSSSTICAMAKIGREGGGRRICEDWQHAFVATFPGTPLDESSFARQVVNHIGIPATFLVIDPLSSLGRLEDYFFNFEEIYPTCPIPMLETYHAIKSEGISVTLDGHGADELMAGYGKALFEAFPAAGVNVKAIREIATTFRNLQLKGSAQFPTQPGTLQLFLGYWLRKWVKKLLGQKRGLSRDRQHPAFGSLDGFNQHLYVLVHETILPTLLRNYDRYSMASGVEIRMPFLDHRLVTFLMSVPWQSKIKDGYTKKIARDAVRPMVPESVASRKSKIGFGSPIVDWMKHELREYFLDSVNSRDFKNCSLIDSEKVRTKIENVVNNEKVPFGDGEEAWTEFSIFLWEKFFLGRASRIKTILSTPGNVSAGHPL